jgi:hypothetical protein
MKQYENILQKSLLDRLDGPKLKRISYEMHVWMKPTGSNRSINLVYAGIEAVLDDTGEVQVAPTVQQTPETPKDLFSD